MRAVVLRAWGDADELRVEDVRDPEPGPGEVVVQLKASSVNWHDVLVRRTGRGFRLPCILGMDGAGTRADTGEEVVVLPALHWGGSRAAPGPNFEFLGDQTDGTYAEQVKVPVENCFAKPANWSWEEAAALPTAGVTAYRALFTRAGVKPDELVVVLGAGSGVSTFAVSLAHGAGARVVVTSSSRAKIERSMALGAEGGVLYTDADWADQLVAITEGGAHVVVDGVGADMPRALSCLRPGGRLAVFGASGGSNVEISIPDLYFSQRSILGTTIGDPRDFAELLALVERSDWRPAIDEVRPLAEVAGAHRRLEARAQFGKLVLQNV